jgi:type II secretory pathway component GspD/PulD (secretin)
MTRQFLKFPIILLFLIIGIVAFSQEKEPNNSDAVSTNINSETNKEEAYREKVELEASQIATDARQAFEKNEYSKAIDYYIDAIKKLKECSANSTYVNNKIKNIQQNMAVIYLYWGREIAIQAEKDAKTGDFDKAIAKCINAMKIDPSLAPKMQNLIERYQNKKKTAKYQSLTDEEIVDPKKESRLYEIDVLMLQGKKLYRDKLWHRAREKFEQILLIDPYNLKAIESIKKLTKKMYKAGKNRYEATQEERNAEVEWNYVSPLIARSLAPSEEAPEPMEREQEGSKIKDKLQNIIIDHMEFEDASISAVVNLLRVRAKDLDPQKEGINIFLRLGGALAVAAPADDEDAEEEDDDFLAEDDDDEGGDDDELIDDAAGDGAGGAEKTITIMFDDLSLGEAIRNICIAADMNYRVEEFAVVVASKNVALDNLETRIYPVEEAFSEVAGGEEGEEGATTSVKDYFMRRGIAFPAEARVVYDNSISRLIATNTHENLRKIEQIIDELNVIDPQVLIEAKFVEIQENKSDELGFQWTISKPAADPRNRNATFDVNDQLLRYDNTAGTSPLGVNDVALDMTKNFHGLATQLQIHAMDLSDRVDVLSTPRITTQNGEEATIRMVTEQYFPESWGETTIITDFTGTGFTAAMPEFGEATEIGVRMTVTPTVDPDKYTISLDMIPVVQTHVGWLNYSYNVSDGAGGILPNTIIMPIIEARTVQTQITIYDGETVVMGGIMRDATETIDDRVPILGDLPLVGRMFRSKYVNKAKANLIIFTTVRLVNPDGSPLREREVRGKPPFRM